MVFIYAPPLGMLISDSVLGLMDRNVSWKLRLKVGDDSISDTLHVCCTIVFLTAQLATDRLQRVRTFFQRGHKRVRKHDW